MGNSNLFGGKNPDLPHLVRGKGGLSGEIKDLRDDIDEAFVAMEGDGGFLYAEEFVNPTAADPDAIKLSIATVAAAVTYSGADLDGAIGAAEMIPPRNVTVTGDGNSDIDAGNLLVTGTVRDKNGRLVAQTETLVITNDLSGVVAGLKAFAFVTSLALDTAQTGTGGLYEFGLGVIIGLAKPLKTRNGVFPVSEIVNGRLAGVDGQVTEEFTNPVASDVDYFMTVRASSASEDIWTSGTTEATAAWIADTEQVPPRNVIIATSTQADIDAVACIVTGFVRDEYGVLIPQTDTITLTDGGATDGIGTRAFSLVTQVVVPAQSGTGATLSFGFEHIIGLGRGIKARAGLLAPIREVEAGSLVTTGTFTTVAAQPPQGTYLANNVPDASRDYAITFEPLDDVGAFVLPATAPPHGTYTPFTAPDGVVDYLVIYAVDPAL